LAQVSMYFVPWGKHILASPSGSQVHVACVIINFVRGIIFCNAFITGYGEGAAQFQG
jgi:hypothetical protein